MDPSIFAFAIDGPIDRADIPEMCDRFRQMLERAGPERVVCSVTALGPPDAVVVDALARLQLTARRLGLQLWLIDTPSELEVLLSLMGLRGVFPLSRPSGVEPRRQPEHREQDRRVQEECDPGDPVG
jgi:ABC-type transporter Mla MlaB component